MSHDDKRAKIEAAGNAAHSEAVARKAHPAVAGEARDSARRNAVAEQFAAEIVQVSDAMKAKHAEGAGPVVKAQADETIAAVRSGLSEFEDAVVIAEAAKLAGF